jgi:hypothetical protein
VDFPILDGGKLRASLQQHYKSFRRLGGNRNAVEPMTTFPNRRDVADILVF